MDSYTFETFEVTAAEFANAHVDTWMADMVLDHVDYRSGEGITPVNMMALVNESDCRSLAGFYYWFCQPGCLPDSDAVGPFSSHHEALKAATLELKGDVGERYAVIVGNLGMVTSTDDRSVAVAEFKDYVALSKRKTGRASGEDVTLMDDGEPLREYYGKD